MNFQSTFNGCEALTSLPDGLFDKNTKVTNFSSCFMDCNGLTSLPVGLFDQNTKVNHFSDCFANCTSLTELPEGLFAKNTVAMNFAFCFSNCTTLKLNKLIFGSTGTDQEDMDRFKDATTPMNFIRCFYNVGKDLANAGEAPTLWSYAGAETWTTINCFTGATKLSNYGNIPTAWGGQK